MGTCHVRVAAHTIQRLREGASSRFFGEFLEQHLDRYLLPTCEQQNHVEGNRPSLNPFAYPFGNITANIVPTTAWRCQGLARYSYQQARKGHFSSQRPDPDRDVMGPEKFRLE